MSSERNLLLADRYLPCRKGTSNESFSIYKTESTQASSSDSTYATFIQASIKRCLSFRHRPIDSSKASTVVKTYTEFENKLQKNKNERKVQILGEEKILRVADVLDDFYLNLFDGTKNGVLAIGLEELYFVWPDQKVISFYTTYDWYKMSCLKFNKSNSLLHVGYCQGGISVIDFEKLKKVRTFQSHVSRIGRIVPTQQWGFLSGSRDNSMIYHDLRLKKPWVLKVLLHRNQVCGLTVKDQIVASGGNDGRVNIWDLRDAGKNVINNHNLHKSAVKALSWCPWKYDLLASGGGSLDHKVILWDIKKSSNQVEKVLVGNSQVTGLEWRKEFNDLLTVHSGCKRNGVELGGYGLIWNIQSGKYEKLMKGHEKRILGSSFGTSEEEIWTLSADETLRLWRTKQNEFKKKQKDISNLSNVGLSVADYHLK